MIEEMLSLRGDALSYARGGALSTLPKIEEMLSHRGDDRGDARLS
jgi:hypothetical protein